MDKYIRKFVRNPENVDKIREYLATISSDERIQRFVLFEVMASRDQAKDMLRQRQFLFSHHTFDDIRLCIQEQEEFLNRPIEVEDGVIDCKKCGSRKTFSYAKQTRASDEGTTVFVTCAQCRHQFRL